MHILTLQRFVSQTPSLIDRPEWYNVVRQRVAAADSIHKGVYETNYVQ
jgi:hypothetical protein